jgi:hypothetical protein
MAKRNYTRELLQKRAKGMTIVISLQPHEGIEARYEPRTSRDPMPWTADLPYRFSGRECHAVQDKPVGRYNQDRVLVLMARNEAPYSYEAGQHDFGFDYTDAELTAILRAMVRDGLVTLEGACFTLTVDGLARLKDTLGEAA